MTDNNETDEPDVMGVDELGNNLYDCADILRGSIDSARYKDFVLPLVFLAGISRQFDDHVEQQLDDYENLESSL